MVRETCERRIRFRVAVVCLLSSPGYRTSRADSRQVEISFRPRLATLDRNLLYFLKAKLHADVVAVVNARAVSYGRSSVEADFRFVDGDRQVGPDA